MPPDLANDARWRVVSIDNRLTPLPAVILPSVRLDDPDRRSLPARSDERWRRSGLLAPKRSRLNLPSVTT
jgi:hypothetical protein